MKVRVTRSFIALSVAGFMGAAGCGTDTPEDSSDANTVPVINIALNRGYAANGGLVTNLDTRGWPNRDAANPMDPTVIEARKFYDTLNAPNAQPEMVDYPDP